MNDADRAIVEDIRKSAADIAVDVAEVKASVKAHLDQKEIHHVPPCKAHVNLTGKLWGLGLALGVLIGGLLVDLWKRSWGLN